MEQDELHAMRHSLAHIMATSVTQLWPHAKLGVGPVVENGFYYDIDLGDTTISQDDFKKIEKTMRKIIGQNQAFERFELPIDEAIAWAKEANQPYKEELLNDLKRAGTTVAKDLDVDELGVAAKDGSVVEQVSFYRNGTFTDLCRGPHVESTGKVGAFKIMRVAGAYWRGKETNPQMQRLYGVAFATQEELDNYLQMLEEAKKRDHRKLGKELDLFTFSDLVGPGLPLFTPRGTIFRDLLGEYSQQIQAASGYQKVMIPHMTRSELYKISGHYDKYPERFMVHSEESEDEFMLKPMSCPHHAQIYASKPRSYKDLPLRYMENTQVYRDEKSGELHGLSRVRMITQDDGHVFCRPEDINEELAAIINMVDELYSGLQMQFRAVLSFRDASDKYLGDKTVWETAQHSLQLAASVNEIPYKIVEGEAAFYGPKVDFMVKDALGREWQCATIQLDFLQPQRFSLEYTDEDGNKKQPIMLHKALLGSIERFMSIYLEHTNGWLPFWLAPEQVRIMTINDSMERYASEIDYILKKIVLENWFERNKLQEKPVKYNQLRSHIDKRNESLGKKIREATLLKIPVQIIVGPKDEASRQVSVRLQGKEEVIPVESLKDYLLKI